MTPQLPKILTAIFLLVCVVGFADATYLTANYFLAAPLPCAVSFLNNCDAVTKSEYAVILDIPVSVMGSFYYLTLLILAVLFLESGNIRAIRLAAFLTPLGFMFSIYLVSLQLFVIHALCMYCLLSALSSTSLFLIGIAILRRTGMFGGSNKSENKIQ